MPVQGTRIMKAMAKVINLTPLPQGFTPAAVPPLGSEVCRDRPVSQRARPSLADLPDMLTVEEAAHVLRIGRNAAYGLAKRWNESGGREGLPVVRLGRTLRIPKRALAQLIAVEVDARPGAVAAEKVAAQ